MRKFKKGDKVVCVDNRNKPITNGKSYIVTSLAKSFDEVIGVWIENDLGIIYHYELYRFKSMGEFRSEVIEDILN